MRDQLFIFFKQKSSEVQTAEIHTFSIISSLNIR